MKLNQILNNIDFNCDKDLNDLSSLSIDDLIYDSRISKENTIFVCLTGETVDGHKYAKSAYDKGCRIFIVEHTIEIPNDAYIIIVENSRRVLSHISSNLFGNPSEELKIIGVTGTKGKTTITNFISGVLNNAGVNTGVIGTNGIFYNGKWIKTVNTTPESYELHKRFREMLDAGVRCVAMEVSSIGLMRHRVSDVAFDIGVFTNLSDDHIGPKEHPTFDNYLECKAMLFKLCKHGIVNADDSYVEDVIKDATCDIERYGISENADINAIEESIHYWRESSALGVTFTCKTKEDEFKCNICTPGLFSVYNALAVIAVSRYLDVEKSLMLDALAKTSVRGRVEVIPALPNRTVVIDYAHNALSLESLLTTLKNYDYTRLICLFGSVGGRTQLRRKELGDVAAKECDFCILTSDNPDFEDPMNIIEDIEKSFTISTSKSKYVKIPDREKAIHFAVDNSKDGDIIVFAGKGHEEYQIVNGTNVPFNERQIVINACKLNNK